MMTDFSVLGELFFWDYELIPGPLDALPQVLLQPLCFLQSRSEHGDGTWVGHQSVGCMALNWKATANREQAAMDFKNKSERVQ